MTPAEEVKSIRLSLGLTWVAFAARVGVTWRTVARWESGESKPPLATLMLARTFKPRKPKGERS